MRTRSFSDRSRVAGRAAAVTWVFVIAAGTLLLAGCDTLDGLLAVDIRDQILAEEMEDPTQASLLANSVQSTFECAFGVHIIVMGLFGSELAYFGTSSGLVSYEAREWAGDFPGGGGCESAVNIGLYGPLNSSRWFADNLLRNLDQWTDAEVPNRSSLIAKTAAHAGYARILMGESQCSGVIDGGPELTTDQIFQFAEERFTQAIAAAGAAGDTDIRNMALVGRARALLNLGRKADAAADAGLVPDGFVYNATASAIDRYRRNRVFDWNNSLKNVGVNVFFQDLSWGGVPDPRVELTLFPSTRTREVFLQNKYTALNAPIPLATWDEAQLIIAEAEGGQTALDIINMFHSRAGLPAFSGTDAEIMDHLIREERRRELFLESHRMGDLRRYNLPFLPPEGAIYEGPAYASVYGNVQCMGLPLIEIENNPLISG